MYDFEETISLNKQVNYLSSYQKSLELLKYDLDTKMKPNEQFLHILNKGDVTQKSAVIIIILTIINLDS